MDDQRFDDLTRALATRGSRRGFLAGLAALAAGLALPGRSGAACPPEQVARRGLCVCKTTGRPPNGDGSCPCPSGRTRCGATCVNLGRDPDHCGVCGAACPDQGPCASRHCRSGVCSSTPIPDNQAGACPAPQVCCGGACTARGGDLANCGACDSGTCRYTPVDCTRGPCEIGSCNAATGACEYDTASMTDVECRPTAGPCDLAEVCDGSSGGCPPDAFQPNTVECRPAGCSAGVAVLAANCPGTGSLCLPEETVACWPYICDDAGLACRDWCESDDDCVPATHCTGEGLCVLDAALGGACDDDEQCQSSHCVEGTCCQQPCPVPFGATAATCSVNGFICGFTCTDGYAPCGAGCCPNACCGDVCCGEGAECDGNGECTVACRALQTPCDGVGQCCLDPDIGCAATGESDDVPVCCHEIGGRCGSAADCCDHAGGTEISCSPEGVCGGPGAACTLNVNCTSEVCCGVGCCHEGQACAADGGCRTADGEPCGGDAECASGLCCGGVCVARTADHCASCDHTCPNQECAFGICDVGTLTCTSEPFPPEWNTACAGGAGTCCGGACCTEICTPQQQCATCIPLDNSG